MKFFIYTDGTHTHTHKRRFWDADVLHFKDIIIIIIYCDFIMIYQLNSSNQTTERGTGNTLQKMVIYIYIYVILYNNLPRSTDQATLRG